MTDHFFINEFINNESSFIPLFSMEDEENLKKQPIPEVLPILPLRNTVLFPGIVIPITVGRNKSIKLVEEYGRTNQPIGVVTQKANETEEPTFEDIYKIGTMARTLKYISMPDGSVTIIVQGIKRIELREFAQTEPYFTAYVSSYETAEHNPQLLKNKKFNALIDSLRDTTLSMLRLKGDIPKEALFALKNIESPFFLLNFISSNLSISIEEKQRILEMENVEERAKVILKFLNKELQLAELKNQIQHKSKMQIDKEQREYFLTQQMKTIQKELGGSPSEKASEELLAKAKNKKWSKETQAIFDKELQKLQRTNSMSPDFSVQLNYLELLVDLPWNEYSEDNFDLDHARKTLDKDHFGLEKIKERIIEYLAVLKLKGDMKSPILCLVGPPGVGKTSLGKSVAKALERKYIRMSLGGLRDESEIRGHRKTYIGAMPGRIIQSLKKAGFANPVFVLDEIDKVLGMNVQGDPSAALLEVLDPEQNNAFYDNYLESTFDLSRVLFIATANTLSTIHPALLDRMEVIEIAGYFLEEKIEIAKQHLIPKQLKEHGIKKNALTFSDSIIEAIITDYTRESGVRLLEKTIAKIIRHRAAKLVQEGKMKKSITKDDLFQILGAPLFQKEHSIDPNVPGVSTGLAWTSVGGEILFVETITSLSKDGGMTLTGNLGDVMKESATIAYEFLKAHATDYGLEPEIFQKKKVHIHVPEGATPKDGPSAGITILSSLISSFTQRKIRPKIAMTGEITLRGKLLPVGGIKEKILAAKRAGIYDIVLSSENKKDVDDIKETFVSGMTFHYFSTMKEAIDYIIL